jgi:hypothetical protein
MKNKLLHTMAELAVFFAICALFAAVALGFVGYFD